MWVRERERVLFSAKYMSEFGVMLRVHCISIRHTIFDWLIMLWLCYYLIYQNDWYFIDHFQYTYSVLSINTHFIMWSNYKLQYRKKHTHSTRANTLRKPTIVGWYIIFNSTPNLLITIYTMYNWKPNTYTRFFIRNLT